MLQNNMFQYTKEQLDWLKAMETQTSRVSMCKYNSMFFFHERFTKNTLDLALIPGYETALSGGSIVYLDLVCKTDRWPLSWRWPKMPVSFKQIAVAIKRRPKYYFTNHWNGYKARTRGI